MNRRYIIFIVVVVLIAAIGTMLVFKSKEKSSAKYKIGITQFVTHPALDEVRMGIESYLRPRIESDQINLVFRNADADFSVASKIAQEFARSDLDMVIPITTVSAQPIVKLIKDIPIVFAGVTDPVGAGLVKHLNSPEGNVTGTSDLWPFNQQFALIRRILKDAQNIGYLYNPGESQAQFALNKVREAANANDFNLIEKQVDQTAIVRTVALIIAGSVDSFYFGMDNTVGQAFDSLLQLCLEAKKPLFAGDASSVEKGALLCLGVDFEELGKETGKIAELILFGDKKPNEIPVWRVESGALYYNSESFLKFGLEVPSFVTEDGKDLAKK